MTDYSLVGMYEVTGDSNFAGIGISHDGFNAYVSGQATDKIFRFPLSTAWDITTVSGSSASASITTNSADPGQIIITADGTSLYVLGVSAWNVGQYSLGTPFDITTLSYVRKLALSTLSNNPTGLAFSPDGSKMFVAAYNSKILEYSLSTEWNISTASLVRTITLDSSVSWFISAMWMSDDGISMYILTPAGAACIRKLTLASAFSLESYTDDVELLLTVDGPGVYPTVYPIYKGIIYSPDKSKLVMLAQTDTVVGTFLHAISAGPPPASVWWTNFSGQTEFTA
jgi:DNA-binding beta-propeller fold protein YncE